MCTVSFIPTKSGFILTSNRNERKNRKTSTSLTSSTVLTETIQFPKDLEAGGTWIASSKNRSFCLLNGAFEPHIRKEKYAKSRGIVLLDGFKFKNTTEFIHQYDFTGIEPFTIIIVNHQDNIRLEKIIWDETQIHYFELDPTEAHLWCSAPLYSPKELIARKAVFNRFVQNWEDLTKDDLMLFHSNKKDTETMLYNNGEKATLSITQITNEHNSTSLNYYDLFSNAEVF